jgi:hypothetical protein
VEKQLREAGIIDGEDGCRQVRWLGIVAQQENCAAFEQGGGFCAGFVKVSWVQYSRGTERKDDGGIANPQKLLHCRCDCF